MAGGQSSQTLANRAQTATKYKIESTGERRGARRSSPRLQSGTNATRGRRFARRGGRRSAKLFRAAVATSVAWARAKTEWGEAAGGRLGCGLRFKEARHGGRALPRRTTWVAVAAASSAGGRFRATREEGDGADRRGPDGQRLRARGRRGGCARYAGLTRLAGPSEARG